MASSVTPATSSLASELLLNKIMNGQVKSSTGKSITAAGRAISSSLSGQAYEARASESNMAYGEQMVSAAQTQISNIKDRLQNLKEQLSAATNNNSTSGTIYKQLGNMAKGVYADISEGALKKISFDGKSLLTGGAQKLNAGGVTVSVLSDLKVYSGGYTGMKAALVNGTVAKITGAGTATAALTAIDTAIQELTMKEGFAGASIKELQNQALVLADKGASLDTAAAGQGLAAMNGAGNLLSSILGSSEA